MFHLRNTSGRETGGLRVCVCVLYVKRETGRHTTHGARAESMWQSAVDTLVMALGRRDEIGDAIRCISADEGCNLARTPFIKAASLPRQIQGYRCCQHHRLRRRAESSNGEPPRATGMERQRCCLSPLIRFYATFSFYILPKLIYRPAPTHTRRARSIP